MSELEPITAELRELMGGVEPHVDEDGVVTAKYVTPEAWGEFAHRCDAIDAVHAGLERENAELRERVAVLDNRSDSMHIGGATVTITDELRKYTCRLSDEAARKSEHGFSPIAMVLEGIADRIDAEHESACAEAYGNGVMSVPIALDESAWVKLPVDADGEVIHVGDVMKTERFGVVEVEGFIHNAIAFNVYDPQPARICTVPANQCRHYHAPTVEDVLREFLDEAEHFHSLEEERDAISEYAKRLTLAGDAE